MVKLAIEFSAECENVESIAPQDESFQWNVKIVCSSCGEESGWVFICENDETEVKGGRGAFNFVSRCKLCSRESQIDIVKGSVTPYLPQGDKKSQRVAVFECRGVEISEFRAGHGWRVVCAESGTKFDEVSFDDGEWADYDENGGQSVSVMDFAFKVVKTK